MIKEKFKKNKLLIFVALAYIICFFYKRDLFDAAGKNTYVYLIEMLKIMPIIFIISALLNNWVPDEVIKKSIGKASGLKGKILALVIGTISAGPIYAAFPVCLSLLKKGGSIANVVVIISAWAVVKLPMFFVESNFLGIKFTSIRYILTIPAIFLLGYLTEKIVKEIKIKNKENSEELENIINTLPGYNCRACGFNSCEEYAKYLLENQNDCNKCKPGGKTTEENLKNLLKNL